MSGNVEIENSTWKIKVNGTEITDGIDRGFTIENIDIAESNHVKPR